MKININPMNSLNEFFEKTKDDTNLRLTSSAVKKIKREALFSVSILESAAVNFDELWASGELPIESAFNAFVVEQNFNAGNYEDVCYV